MNKYATIILKQIKDHQVLATIAMLVSVLIFIKYGIIEYILLILFYFIATILMANMEVMFHPKHPYHKFKKFIRGCFALEDDIWLDNSLDKEFTALTNYCKENKRTIRLFSEQIENFSRAIKENPELKVFDRIAAMQTAKILDIFQAVKAAPKKNPCTDCFEGEIDEKTTKIGIIYEVPPAPKTPKSKMEFIKAIKHYCTKCEDMTYVSKDAEIKVRLTDFMQKEPGKKINFLPLKDFVKSFEYIDKYKISFIETHKKNKKAKATKKADKKKQMDNFTEAVAAVASPKAEALKKKLIEKTDK